MVVAAILIGGCAKPQPDALQPLLGRIPDWVQKTGYGYGVDDPVLVAGLPGATSPAKERYYLRLLRGPNGETVSYMRLGSCCRFETSNSPLGAGFLDQYIITYPGLDVHVAIYLNMGLNGYN